MINTMPSDNVDEQNSYTDEESQANINENSRYVNSTDVRTVATNETGQGFETSFLIVNPDEAYDDDEKTWRGNWLCRPYKRERLLEEIQSANKKGAAGHAAVLSTLKNAGVKIFIVDSKVSSTMQDIMDSVHNVIHHVAKERRSRPVFNPRNTQRCILYRDVEGRFFNLTLTDHTTASLGQWKTLLDSFSCLQAISVLAILCRSFACSTEADNIIDQFRPASLGLLLGLVFKEEISLSWTNVGMFVRGMPSISAFSVTSNVESDWLRKTLVFFLTIASATTGNFQYVLTLAGLTLACSVVLANLGARAWRFLRWKPMPYNGPFEPVVSYLVAMVAGACFPYLAHRKIEAGGKPAMESVIRVAFAVAIVFVLSDYDDFQKFLIVGSQYCNQDSVNVVVGAWWTLSLILSLFTVMKLEPESPWPDDEEPLLEEDHASPVGFKVPNLPDFPIDPSLATAGIEFLTIQMELIMGLIMAVAFGTGIMFLSFTSYDEELADKLMNATNY